MSVTGELILYLMLAPPLLHRWKEASGADAVCGSCDSAVSSGGIGAGAAGGSWSGGSGGGSTSLSNPGRKVRDVSQSMLSSITIFFIGVDIMLSRSIFYFTCLDELISHCMRACIVR